MPEISIYEPMASEPGLHLRSAGLANFKLAPTQAKVTVASSDMCSHFGSAVSGDHYIYIYIICIYVI